MQLEELNELAESTRQEQQEEKHCIRVCMAAGCQSSGATEILEGLQNGTADAEGVTVKVGSVAHPMEEKHYIEWVEILVDGKAYRQFLKPGEAPEAKFAGFKEGVVAREYCNLHGLWKG